MNDRILSAVGLACRAGRIKSGELPVEQAIKSGKTALLIVASDASENTKKKLTDKCSRRNIPCITYADMEMLGRAVGKGDRAAVAILDEGFAKSILKQLPEG
ncbi:MAG: ribosomal L7Ae/L30e/S12e/Gadd45 family protein [Lachnospiraceae bacterium]|nr:ribosomal L7Ae/L30e/S12e/Gadd45 family protein [Lachnospiraceae bacterium]